MKLRNYQQQAIDDLRQALREGRRTVCLMLPTGAGKTVIAASIIWSALNKNKRVMFICDRTILIEQTSQTLDRHGIDHGIIQANHPRWKPELPVQVCSIQTLARRRNKPHADLVLVDEAHTLYKAQTDMMKDWSAVPFIGLTATPFTCGMGNYWQRLIAGPSIAQLIGDGYLCDFEVYGPPPPDLSGVTIKSGEFNQSQLAEKVNTRTIVGDVVRTWQSLGQDRQTLCFAVSVAHSKQIIAEFNHYGIPAAHIDAYTDDEERQQILTRFRKKEIRVISSVDVLTKGVDEPSATCLIMARPTRSLITYIQQFGRILRPDKDNQIAIVLDHGGNVARHGFPTDPLPTTFRNGSASRGQNEQRERLPKPCPRCFYMKEPGQHECPQCGFKPERVNDVGNTDEHLVKLRRKSDTGLLPEDRNKWYAMLLGYCLAYARPGSNPTGRAAHLYREKFGTWPIHTQEIEPLEPDSEIRAWVKHCNIRYAKRRNVTPGPIKTCLPGYHYQWHTFRDGRRMIICRESQTGKFIGWATQSNDIIAAADRSNP